MPRPNRRGPGIAKAIVLTALLIAVPFTPVAHAGDVASRHIIGFSPDGRYFAFEQYGAQDGSGFPYSEIFVIDTAKDEWLPGTPIRKLIQDETEKARPEDARKAAAAEAKPLLTRLGIGKQGETLFSDPDGGSDPTAKDGLAWQRRARFLLREHSTPSPRCSDFSVPFPKGFSLWLENSVKPELLHEDRTLPESRGCPISYAINDVIRFDYRDSPAYAVLIRMETLPGFEGPDTRYLAVTRRAP